MRVKERRIKYEFVKSVDFKRIILRNFFNDKCKYDHVAKPEEKKIPSKDLRLEFLDVFV